MNSKLRISPDLENVREDQIGASPVQMIEKVNQFNLIRQSATSLILWQREIPNEVQTWLSKLTQVPAEDIRFTVKPEAFEEVFNPMQASLPLSKGIGALWLIKDMGALVRAFAEVAGASCVEVRLEWIDGDGCWKFHQDYVSYRLVATYDGAGTEWVPPAYARQALAHQRTYSGPLEKLLAGDVAIFKGCRNNPDDGIVHRSPALSQKGGKRLFLCLNVGRDPN